MNVYVSQAVPVRLARLRAVMARERLDAYIVLSSDPHRSEYLPAYWQSRAWFSGFTGSAGTLIVTKNFAGVWVDSRYWTQAETQLAGSGITRMKITAQSAAPYLDWLLAHTPQGGIVGVDGAVLDLASTRALLKTLGTRAIELRAIDLLDIDPTLWPDRPPLPMNPVFEHAWPYAAMPRAQKRARIRAAMREHGADWHFISTLDDIAWLFNIRGADVPYNPVFIAHALIGPASATLFVTSGKIPAPLAESLAEDGVALAPYEQAGDALARLPAGTTLLLDPRRTTWTFAQRIPEQVRVIEAIHPSTLEKSRKTRSEAAQIRSAMAQDGTALCEFFAWFERALGSQTMTELTIDEQLTAARARQTDFITPSFATIAAFNANGAMPHYQASAASHAKICGAGLLLIDSGGHYLGGTTDITRVVPIGTPSAAQKRDFTLVLKGVIALSKARFPNRIRAPMLDALARAPLWAEGIDYGHGTGHGVGYCLNVHEGPQVISYHAKARPETAMEEGMVTSIEPGIYRPGQWGVRIENLVLNCSVQSAEEVDGENAFLEFETLTLCPIDTRCIERDLLHTDEIDWLNAYHAMVRSRLAPRLSGAARVWLEERASAI